VTFDRGNDAVTTEQPTLARSKNVARLALLMMPLAAVALAVLGSQNPLLAIVAALALPAAYALIAWPEVATLATIFILYTNAADVAVTFHKVPYIVGAAFILLTIPLTHYVVRERLVVTPALPWVVKLFATCRLRGATARYPEEVRSHQVRGGRTGCLHPRDQCRAPETRARVCWTLLAAGTLMAAIPVYQQVAGKYDNNFGGFGQVSQGVFNVPDSGSQNVVQQPRLTGPIGEKNRYAQIMLMLIPVGLFLGVGESKKSLRWLALGVTVLMLAGMSMAFSRGAAVAVAVLVLLMVWMKYITRKQFACVLVGLVLLLCAVPEYANRIARLQGVWGLITPAETAQDIRPDSALRGRAVEVLAAVRIFIDHPVLGVGPGMYNNYYLEYAELVGDEAETITREAHNLYPGIGAETGVLGLTCFMAAIFVTMKHLAQTRRRLLTENPRSAQIATGFLLTIVSYLMTGMTLHMSFGRFFWLMMALAASASLVVGRQPQQSLEIKEAA
jgi:hypothetical protein